MKNHLIVAVLHFHRISPLLSWWEVWQQACIYSARKELRVLHLDHQAAEWRLFVTLGVAWAYIRCQSPSPHWHASSNKAIPHPIRPLVLRLPMSKHSNTYLWGPYLFKPPQWHRRSSFPACSHLAIIFIPSLALKPSSELRNIGKTTETSSLVDWATTTGFLDVQPTASHCWSSWIEACKLSE